MLKKLLDISVLNLPVTTADGSLGRALQMKGRGKRRRERERDKGGI